MNWWWARDGERHGPMEEEAFRQMVARGELKPDDLVWNETMTTWSRASQVPGLFAPSPQTSAAGNLADGPTPNGRLMELAMASLSGHWGAAIGVILIVTAIQILVSFVPIAGNLAGLLLSGPLLVGQHLFFLTLARRGDPKVEQVFSGFQRFGQALGAFLLVTIFTLLWMLLFIIPGIIKAYSYSQTYFILADNPNIGPMEAIDRSMALMDGHKWKLFCLHVRFLGWFILAVLTCGLGGLFVSPYFMTALAHFYEDLCRQAPARQP